MQKFISLFGEGIFTIEVSLPPEPPNLGPNLAKKICILAETKKRILF
jgi:hypothetical protein